MDVDTRLLGRVWDLLRARDARPRPRVENRPTVSVVDVDGGTAELRIYAEIGYWGVTAQDVADQLEGVHGDLHVRINSPGGDVFDGYAIFNMLGAHDGQITVTVEGLAASAASFIAMAGDEIRMCLASQMMIHDASGICIGNAQDMRDWAAVLDSVSTTIAGVYAERAGGDDSAWRGLMQAETWYTPQEAVDAGLADEVITPQRQRDPNADEPAAAARWDLSVFMYAGRAHAPAPARPTAVESVTPVTVTATAVGPHQTETTDTPPAPATEEDSSDELTEALADGPPESRETEADPDTEWAALVGGLLTAPAPVSAPSTVDELLGDLRQKGWRAAA